MKKKIPTEISEHFKKLGKKSWESRKKALIERAKNTPQEKEVVK